MMKSTESLTAYLRESDALLAASRILQWDQQVLMPSAGAAARADSLAALAKLHHARSIAPELEALVEKVAAHAPAGSPEFRLAELVRRNLERGRRIPASLVESFSRATAKSESAWEKARKSKDFSLYSPFLKEVIRLSAEIGRCLAPAGGTPYDGLLSDYEYGMDTASWDALLFPLEARLKELIPRILDRQKEMRAEVAACSALRGPFQDAEQMAAGRQLAADIGFDFGAGRLDLSTHPFSETMHAGDARITTRFEKNDLTSSFLSILHETGHAIYEQGLPADWAGTPLGAAVSMAVHESQSRLWENLVGRSQSFWENEKPRLEPLFPALRSIPLGTFLAALNLVQPSLIRTESDEVTYNLHILVRYRLEKALIGGDLDVNELPEAWNDACEDSLGIRPSNDTEGVMQDIHWADGSFGYFPTYTLGNILSAQFFTAAREAVDVRDCAALRDWLHREVHSHGHQYDTHALVRRATGRELSTDDFLAYLEGKYL